MQSAFAANLVVASEPTIIAVSQVSCFLRVIQSGDAPAAVATGEWKAGAPEQPWEMIA